MKNLTKNTKRVLLILAFITVAAVWVRTYNHHDWLFFKWDQARDATLLSYAIENGPEHLPLLGPRAAKADGDYLRLGPAYYYTQYISGVLFQSTKPDVFAYPDLLFSILTIPMFFIFLRLYFSRRLSLLSTALYAGSFIIIQHSRFSWNPNSVPLFMLLALYGLLQFTRAREFKYKLRWISLWAFAFAIASQYHFFALFSLTATSGAFIFFYILSDDKEKFLSKKRFKRIKRTVFSKTTVFYTLASLLIIGFLYFPVILSEMNSSWNNTKRFISVVADRSDIDDGEAIEESSKAKTFEEKLKRNFREQAKGYSLITIGKSHRKGNKADPITITFGLFLLFGSLLLAYKEMRIKADSSKKNFLLILLLWSGLFFIITIPNSYQLRPRYFSPVFPVPFIMLALWFSFLDKKLAKNYWVFVGMIAFILLAFNARETSLWFKEQADSQIKSIDTYRTFILKREDGVTLGQLERATDYIYKNKNSKTVLFYTKPEYKAPVKYLLSQNKDSNLNLVSADNVGRLEGVDTLFVVVTKRGGTDSIKKAIAPFLTEVSQKQFGQLMVFEMKIDKEKVTANRKEKLLKEKNSPAKKSEVVVEKIPRLFWKDFVGTDDKPEKSEDLKEME